jgi:histidine triad (HIT) family protein
MEKSFDENCLFCKIIRGDIPAAVESRTAEYIVLRDISPQAPEHVLVIPTGHVPAISQHTNPATLGSLVAAAAAKGAQLGGDQGFRLVVNEGTMGGQTVDHLHVHILAGRQMTWPPG